MDDNNVSTWEEPGDGAEVAPVVEPVKVKGKARVDGPREKIVAKPVKPVPRKAVMVFDADLADKWLRLGYMRRSGFADEIIVEDVLLDKEMFLLISLAIRALKPGGKLTIPAAYAGFYILGDLSIAREDKVAETVTYEKPF